MRDLVRAGDEGRGARHRFGADLRAGFYATTEELIEIWKVAAKHQGIYISHMSSEGNRLVEAVEELIRISREAGIPAEIYHLKAAGQANWPKWTGSSSWSKRRARPARESPPTCIPTPPGGTGLDAAMPPWAQDGASSAGSSGSGIRRAQAKIAPEIRTPTDDWENLYLAAGSPERVLFVGFKSEALKPLTGKTLAEVARERGTSPEETIMDLVLEDRSRVGTITS